MEDRIQIDEDALRLFRSSLSEFADTVKTNADKLQSLISQSYVYMRDDHSKAILNKAEGNLSDIGFCLDQITQLCQKADDILQELNSTSS